MPFDAHLQLQSWPARYGAAVGMYLLVLVIRLILFPVDQGFLLLSFYPAVLGAFYLAGAGPGILVVALASLTGYLLFVPGYWSVPAFRQDVLATAIFAATALLSGLIVYLVQSSASRLRSALEDLQKTQFENQQLLRDQAQILDNQLIGMIRIRDADRSILWTNKAFDQIYGYATGELAGKPSRILYPSDASYESLGATSRVELGAARQFRTQLEISRTNGEKAWVDISGMRLAPQSGESMWMLLDITQSKQAEAGRLRAAELEAQNRQILETSRLKGMFLANMSHELRTPLNAIIGFSRILQTGDVTPGSPRYAAYMGNILTSGEHLLQLIDATLDLTRIESGKLDFAVQAVELPALVSELFSILQPTFERKRMTVVTQIDPALPTLHIDPLRLKQVILNYLTNAIKFTPEGGHITLRAWPEEPGRFRLEVEDSGIGIAAADIPRLFTEFEQLQAASNRQYQGTGLGLALTRRLVEAQGGSVGVRSTPGAGSVFHVVLPRAPAVG